VEGLPAGGAPLAKNPQPLRQPSEELSSLCFLVQCLVVLRRVLMCCPAPLSQAVFRKGGRCPAVWFHGVCTLHPLAYWREARWLDEGNRWLNAEYPTAGAWELAGQNH